MLPSLHYPNSKTRYTTEKENNVMILYVSNNHVKIQPTVTSYTSKTPNSRSSIQESPLLSPQVVHNSKHPSL